jgi:protein-tyrosine phosphatase
MEPKPVRVLFVCLANICRSPMAQAVFLDQVSKAGLEGQIEADSAGTAHWRVGEQPYVETLKVLAARGITITHEARLLQPSDLHAFDYILTMDNEVLKAVTYFGRRSARLEPLLKYAQGCGYVEVPDPLGTGNFELVYELVSKASEGLLQAIRRERNL